MSYRDIRNFSEEMRSLGFPHPISLESFRTPNFPLVEAALRWLACSLEPEAALAGGGGSMEERVALVTHAVAFFLSRANVKLNGRRIYGAEGWAARELMKVSGLLKAAVAAPAQHGPPDHLPSYDVSSRLGEIKQARQLATELTARGAALHDLLGKEPEHREARDRALSRPLDLSSMETSLRLALEAVTSRVASTREQLAAAGGGGGALDAKIERRRGELQRAEQRLRTVHSIKPAYQGELVAVESEIAELWEQYVLRYRCVEALKHQLSVLENAQAEAAEEQQAAIMQLIHKYEAEDVLGKLSDSDEMYSSDETKAPSAAPRPATRPKTRLRIKTAGVPAAEARRAFGSMAAAARDSLDDIRDEDSLSDDEPSDTLHGGREDTASRWTRAGRRPPRPATRTIPIDDDDEDILEGMEAGSAGDSLGSSSESELRVGSAARRPSAAPGRASALSDNEF
ncbi:clusterin-associated protein 1 [Plutella xylostella]|uniref:clusterin-associated protein 1 n=1 Tax=Plutella xylostella TaxID=51655 RepID=UPI0020330F63|nr:clusterin-associated protein 1 [Plutella xylostella]